MISEEDMEDAIAANPERYLEEKGLKLITRQYKIGTYYVPDLLFEDRHGTKLIVELQKGTLDRYHTYKIIDYYHGYKEKNPDEFIRLMIVANKIPGERKKRLSSWGILFKEIPVIEFLDKDKLLAPSVQYDVVEPIKKPSNIFQHPKSISSMWDLNELEKVDRWLRQEINTLPIREPIKIREIAIPSRNVAYITPLRNIEGVRYLLWKLHRERYIRCTDNLHFVVLKRIE